MSVVLVFCCLLWVWITLSSNTSLRRRLVTFDHLSSWPRPWALWYNGVRLKVCVCACVWVQCVCSAGWLDAGLQNKLKEIKRFLVAQTRNKSSVFWSWSKQSSSMILRTGLVTPFMGGFLLLTLWWSEPVWSPFVWLPSALLEGFGFPLYRDNATL